MEKFTDQQLKDELSKRGFFTDNLWSVHDVKGIFRVDDDEAQEVLEKSLTNDATMEQIWLSIGIFGDMEGYERIEE